MSSGDIDIDVSPSFDRTLFQWTRASMVRDGKLVQHPCGFHPQSIPLDPLTKLSAVPYEAAEALGYFKIDFLNLNVYQNITSRAELKELIERAPDWSLLLVDSNHPKLFQLANHGELLLKLQPRSIMELADVLALIRPGKKQLLALYQKNKELARMALWSGSTEGYTFKLSHALSYAYVIVLQLHLIEQGRL